MCVCVRYISIMTLAAAAGFDSRFAAVFKKCIRNVLVTDTPLQYRRERPMSHNFRIEIIGPTMIFFFSPHYCCINKRQMSATACETYCAAKIGDVNA